MDADREDVAKANGMARAANAHGGDLSYLRALAAQYATRNGTVTIDNVRDWAHQNGFMPPPGNYLGALFSGDPRFVATGDFVKSTHRGSHRRMVRVWRLA